MCDRISTTGSQQPTTPNTIPTDKKRLVGLATLSVAPKELNIMSSNPSSSSFKGLFPKKRPRAATVETVVASTGFPVSQRPKRHNNSSSALHLACLWRWPRGQLASARRPRGARRPRRIELVMRSRSLFWSVNAPVRIERRNGPYDS